MPCSLLYCRSVVTGFMLTSVLGEERLPAREGWRAPASIDGLSTASVILQLAMATDEKATDLVLPPSKRGFSHMGEVVL